MYCVQPITIQVPIKGIKAFQDLEVPCGRCIGCRIAKRKEWSLRMLHELTYHPQSSFITLTYDDYHLPTDNSLKKRQFLLSPPLNREGSVVTGAFSFSAIRILFHAAIS